MLKAQYDHEAGTDSGTIGLEWELPWSFNADSGIAFYADGTLGERKQQTIMAGIRVYLGGGVDT